MTAEAVVKQEDPQKYKIDKEHPGTDKCAHFRFVTHTTHIHQALTIMETDIIKSGLVYDKSHLNNNRIPVVWMSPNVWNVGYRYGTIKYEFDWNRLLEGKKKYWVEVVHYEIPALRILITDRDYSKHQDLRVYNPESADGPWWYDSVMDLHYFNSSHCLEFMIEDDVPLSLCTGVSFVDHHNKYCCIHRTSPKTCKELGLRKSEGGSRFIGRIIYAGLDPELLNLTEDTLDGIEPTSDLKVAWSCLRDFLIESDYSYDGCITSDSDQVDALGRAILNSYGNFNSDDIEELASLFASEEDLLLCCRQIVADYFDIEEGALRLVIKGKKY